MTNLQNEYWKAREQERHNREMENVDLSKLEETKRHNIEEERIGSREAGAHEATAAAKGIESFAKVISTIVGVAGLLI